MTTMQDKSSKDSRNRDLAAIHASVKKLGIDDPTYRDMLWSIARVRSAKDLDWAGRRRVLEHLRARGAGGKRPKKSGGEWEFVDHALIEKQPLLRRIIVFCRDLGIERGTQKKYVEGIARQMTGVSLPVVEKPIELCSYDELKRIALALQYALRRQQTPRENGRRS